MSHSSTVAVVSFPGNNCEVETLRAIRSAGLDPLYFRWNDDRSKLRDVHAYILPGGFSYEDRGRSGMVAARDSLFDHIGAEAERGKTVLGICNGAQMLVESGLIPNAQGLKLSLAHNEVDGIHAGFLSQWVWIRRVCKAGRAAATDWEGQLHVPIAHGEGRYTTKDKELVADLQKNDQIVFQYCNEEGLVHEYWPVTPNGAMHAIAGLCNPAGNVVCLMPHPERSAASSVFFRSLAHWIEQQHPVPQQSRLPSSATSLQTIATEEPTGVELFIGTTITNNEERTVEQALRRILPSVRLRQWSYRRGEDENILLLLNDLTVFNANKQRAYIRRHGILSQWNATTRREQPIEVTTVFPPDSLELLRMNGDTSNCGVLYCITGVENDDVLHSNRFLEVLHNPHASTLTRLL